MLSIYSPSSLGRNLVFSKLCNTFSSNTNSFEDCAIAYDKASFSSVLDDLTMMMMMMMVTMVLLIVKVTEMVIMLVVMMIMITSVSFDRISRVDWD